MKLLNLIYNDITNTYIFYEGYFNGKQSNRLDLEAEMFTSPKKIKKGLGGVIDNKRKSILSVFDIPSASFILLKKYFESSNVVLKIPENKI